jgi:general secretion pathway protein D
LNGLRLTLLCCVLVITACANFEVNQKTQEADAQFSQARQMAAKGQTDEAIDSITALSKLYPENPQYRNWLKVQLDKNVSTQLKNADLLFAQQDFTEAEVAYQEILRNNPRQQAALDGIKRTRQAQNHAMMLANAQAAYVKQENTTAQNLVRAILAEDSQHAGAKTLYETIENQQSDKVTAVPSMQAAFKKPVTLELKNTPIKSAFEYLSKAGNINFSYDQELSGAILVNVFLRNTPIEDAIDVILSSHQLGKKVLNANTLLIYPLSRSQEYQEMYVRSFYLNNIDAKRAMTLLKTVLKVKDVYMDEKLNTLVIRDTLENVQIAEKLIVSQDLNEPEVMLEVEVMEINRRNFEQLGLQYPSQIGLGVQGNAKAGIGGVTPIPGELTFSELKHFKGDFGVFSVSDPALVLNLLHQDTDTNLLANPKIRVKNRDKAKIHVGDKIPVLTSVANSTGFVSQTVSYIEVGIKLDVQPIIQLQDQVSIRVSMEVSNVTDQVKTDSGVLAYTIGSRNAITTLQLKNNETQILAGLFRDDTQKIKRKVPGLGSLPLIGRLFADDSNDNRKNEIVLLITPRILHNLTPVSSTYSNFPSGVSHGNTRDNRPSAQQSEPAPAQVQPLPTPQNIQYDNSKTDQEFANQLLNSSPEEPPPGTNPTTTIIQSQ